MDFLKSINNKEKFDLKMCINKANEELYLESSELLFEMKKNHFKGTYKIIGNDSIECRIQDDVTIMINIDKGGLSFIIKIHMK